MQCNYVQQFYIGAKGFLTTKHHFFNLSTTATALCEVRYFMKCKLAKISDEKAPQKIMWFAAVQLMMEHPCKVWLATQLKYGVLCLMHLTSPLYHYHQFSHV